MPRKFDKDEEKRELFEADLGRLGTSLVYLRLVQERVNQAMQNGQTPVLGPAVDDLHRVASLIRDTQVSIAKQKDGSHAAH